MNTDIPAHTVGAKDDLVVQLVAEEGLGVAQIAERLKCSRTNVYRILGKDEVQQRILSKARDQLAFSSVGAASTLVRLAGSAKSEFVQMQSAMGILDRVGISQPVDNQGLLQIQINLGDE